MAEAVGLGKIGKNGLLFNSVYGPRLMLGGIVTTASLPTLTWPEKDESGCPEDCFICQDICPAKAIDRKGKVDRPACGKHSMQSPLLSFLLKSKEIRVEDISTVFNTAGVDGNSMYTCTKCVSDCPRC
jgi:epoxyqueuosine reductase QueG